MNDRQWELILEFLKAGGVLVGIAIALLAAWVIAKYFVPVLTALKPNGDKNDGGSLFLVLQQVASIPAELSNLTTELRTMKDYMWTKAEIMEEMRKNRHEIAAQVAEPITSMTLEVRRVLEDRRISGERRSVIRKVGDRRKGGR